MQTQQIREVGAHSAEECHALRGTAADQERRVEGGKIEGTSTNRGCTRRCRGRRAELKNVGDVT